MVATLGTPSLAAPASVVLLRSGQESKAERDEEEAGHGVESAAYQGAFERAGSMRNGDGIEREPDERERPRTRARGEAAW